MLRLSAWLVALVAAAAYPQVDGQNLLGLTGRASAAGGSVRRLSAWLVALVAAAAYPQVDGQNLLGLARVQLFLLKHEMNI